jgi:hypothetical protein
VSSPGLRRKSTLRHSSNNVSSPGFKHKSGLNSTSVVSPGIKRASPVRQSEHVSFYESEPSLGSPLRVKPSENVSIASPSIVSEED